MQDPNDLDGENPESEVSIVQSDQVNELFIVQAEPNDGITATEDAQNTPLQNEKRSFIEQVDDAEQAPQEETIVEQWQQSSQNEDIVKEAAEEKNPASDENDIVLEAAVEVPTDDSVEKVVAEEQEISRHDEENPASDEKDVVLEAAAGEQPDENVEEVIEEKQETDGQDEENPASDEKDIVLEAAVEEPTDDNVEKVVDEEQETSRHDEENPTSDEKDIVLETAVEQPTDDNVEEKQEIIQQSTMTAAMTAVAQAIAGSRDTTTSTSLGIPTELVDIAYSHLVVQSTLSNELHKKNEDSDSDEEFVVESKHVEDKAEEKHKEVEEKAKKDRKKANVVVDKKIAVVKTLGDDIVRRLEKKGAVKLAGHGFMTSVFTKGGISLEINKTIPPISGDELSSVLPKPKFNKTAILNAAPPPTWLKNRYGIHPKSSTQHNFHANSHPISLSIRPATQSLPIRPTSKHYKLIRELKHKREGEITELLLGYTAQTKSYLRKTSYPKMPRLNPFLPLTNTDHIMTCKTLALKPQSLIPSYNKRLPATHTFARLGKIGKGKEEGIKSYVDEKEMERGDIRARKGKKMAVTVVPVQRE